MQSRLYLPKIESAPDRILEYLVERFPQVLAQTWRERIARGLVTLDDGTTLTADTPYRHGVTVLYYREVPEEPLPVESETIVYQDAEILVADKPHGMVVTPAGDHAERSLLSRLQRSTGLATLAPIHRLDRETAGIVLFSVSAVNAAARGRYHQLFADRIVEREYLAVAHFVNGTGQREWVVKNRMEPGEPWYRRRVSANTTDEPNAITRIALIESQDEFGFFRLQPETGKKHQLRVHMASIGFPIAGDLLYPEIRERRDSDPPLQLLAHRLSFIDPLSGEPRNFTSSRKLQWPLLRPME